MTKSFLRIKPPISYREIIYIIAIDVARKEFHVITFEINVILLVVDCIARKQRFPGRHYQFKKKILKIFQVKCYIESIDFKDLTQWT